jgi:hypothetical protein
VGTSCSISRRKFTPDRASNEARSGFESGALPEGTKVSVAGRITAHREMGKSMFIDVRDQSGRIQVYAQKNVLGDEQWNTFTHLDLGDFIGVTGTLFRTKTGEPSIKLGGTPEVGAWGGADPPPPPAPPTTPKARRPYHRNGSRGRSPHQSTLRHPRQGAASAAGQVARAGGHGDSLSSALP